MHFCIGLNEWLPVIHSDEQKRAETFTGALSGPVSNCNQTTTRRGVKSSCLTNLSRKAAKSIECISTWRHLPTGFVCWSGNRLKSDKLIFQCRLSETVPRHALGDQAGIMQILKSLIDMAFACTPKSASVSLKITSGDADQLVFMIIGKEVEISKEALHEIHEPFRCLHPRSSEQTGNPGLASVKKLVETMQGTVSVISEPGRGTVFTVMIPIEPGRDEIEAPEPSQDESFQQLKTKAILVVEDNIMNRALLEALFETAEIFPEFADDGESAYALCQEKQFDLILMDINLPKMNGIETSEKIHRLSGYETVPIIAVSAEKLETDERLEKRTGIIKSISKPIDFDRLMHLMSEYS